jgi:hypothetical protein
MRSRGVSPASTERSGSDSGSPSARSRWAPAFFSGIALLLGNGLVLTAVHVLMPVILLRSIRYYAGAVSEPWYLLAAAAALILAVALSRRAEAGNRRSMGTAIGLGFVLAASVLFRAQAIVLIPAILIALLVRRATWRSAAITAAASLFPDRVARLARRESGGWTVRHADDQLYTPDPVRRRGAGCHQDHDRHERPGVFRTVGPRSRHGNLGAALLCRMSRRIGVGSETPAPDCRRRCNGCGGAAYVHAGQVVATLFADSPRRLWAPDRAVGDRRRRPCSRAGRPAWQSTCARCGFSRSVGARHARHGRCFSSVREIGIGAANTSPDDRFR